MVSVRVPCRTRQRKDPQRKILYSKRLRMKNARKVDKKKPKQAGPRYAHERRVSRLFEEQTRKTTQGNENAERMW